MTDGQLKPTERRRLFPLIIDAHDSLCKFGIEIAVR